MQNKIEKYMGKNEIDMSKRKFMVWSCWTQQNRSKKIEIFNLTCKEQTYKKREGNEQQRWRKKTFSKTWIEAKSNKKKVRKVERAENHSNLRLYSNSDACSKKIAWHSYVSNTN